VQYETMVSDAIHNHRIIVTYWCLLSYTVHGPSTCALMHSFHTIFILDKAMPFFNALIWRELLTLNSGLQSLV